ncbi:MAG TPA: LacI family transcriptional regulator [Opitutae bacterium]|nr:LacI family transcriptional regulator [Puniceicoccaceae bacterium]HBR93261.1 LacI family transcriptional regulator [Opitutae bacterium]
MAGRIHLEKSTKMITVSFMVETSNQPTRSGRRVTLDDVAAEAGVSRITVSRVVRQSKLVKASTAAKVMAAIDALGYRPDPMLSALSAYRSAGAALKDGGTLIFLDCDGTEYSRAVFQGASAESQRLGYRIESQRMPSTLKEQSHLSRVYYHRGVRGLLLGPSYHEVDFSAWDMDAFSSVSLGALTHQPAMNSVAMDYFQGAHRACRILKARGCRRIGFAVGDAFETRTGNRWLGGYLAGIGRQTPLVYPGEWSSPERFKQWRLKAKVDGVMTIHPELLSGWGRRKDRFIFLNDYLLELNPSFKSLTYLSLDRGAIGAEGVRILHHDLMRQQYGIPDAPKLSMLQGHWLNL